ncbi:MAG: hypothetical protein M9931_11970 [Chitinophagales bacterium]|nr:hypothetical protein [Chitinophagales bacterium]MCO5281750.1 hypothetical protein [Chitinophagales bacterium]OJV29066.1 MAG: hypothetical protein BGO32_07130 [Bacteroidetes bacterium 37-13]HRN94619.1 hypothetical protein [Chitinophagales bacterium]HRP39894.1 hypothetical protein [Chitinophagales bacterium]
MSFSEARLKQLLDLELQSPNDPFLKFALAQEYAAMPDRIAAEMYYEILLEKFPDYLPTYYQYAKLQEEKNETATAKDWYEQGIALAKKQADSKTLSELEAALFLLD